MDVDWQADLDRWLAPFVAALRHKTRARMCPLYVAGLIGPGDRKSVQPMAARASGVGYDQLHHFVAAGVWDSAPSGATTMITATVYCSVNTTTFRTSGMTLPARRIAPLMRS